MKKLTSNKAGIRNLMESSVWFRGMSTTKINEILINSELREYQKTEIVHRDFAQNELIFLVTGSVWTCIIGMSIDTKFGVLLPSSLIGLSELIENKSTLVPFFDFKAAETCLVLAIPTNVFLAVFESSSNQWQVIAEEVIRYHRRCIRLMLGMYTGPIKNRVISAIHHFSVPSLQEKNSASITIDLTQDVIAVLIRSSRQHVNKALTTLESEKILRVGYKKIEIIDQAAFVKLASSLLPPLVKLD